MARKNTIYILVTGNENHKRLYNSLGVTLYQNEFAVIGSGSKGVSVIGDEETASAATGGMDISSGDTIQTSDLKVAENTFGTPGQPVCWDPSGGKFSDTPTAAYWLVGILTKAKDSNGVIEFLRQQPADLLESDET